MVKVWVEAEVAAGVAERSAGATVQEAAESQPVPLASLSVIQR
jgi:hypothetical protein